MTDNKPAMITGLIDNWKLRTAELKEQLQLKYLPVDFDVDKVAEYERYLEMSDADQKAFLADLTTDEIEFWISLETSRALYKDPVDRPSSITQAKLDKYPERYGYAKKP